MANSDAPGNAHRPPIDDEQTFRPTTARPPPLDRPSITDRPSRLSIYYHQVFKPRWKPWSPAKVAVTALGFGALMSLLVALAPKLVYRVKVYVFPASVPAAEAALEPVVAPAPVGPRADAALARKGRSPLAGGLLTLPTAFASADGAYDLVIHFHGNTDLVEESYEKLGVNAAVVILNLGNGSGPYEDRFANPLSLPEVLGRVQTTLEKRGLTSPRLRRLGLTAWSAGYGAVLRILEQPALAEQVDAVVLLDGIHCGYQPKSTELQLARIAPFERFAREAVAGKRLFSITHSEITPIGSYAGTRRTTDALLELLGLTRGPAGEAPSVPALTSIDGVIPRKILKPMVPESEVRMGGFHVRGFAGDQPEHHTMHLVEMSVTALPDLRERWASAAAN